jgi:hypothetical protein
MARFRPEFDEKTARSYINIVWQFQMEMQAKNDLILSLDAAEIRCL